MLFISREKDEIVNVFEESIFVTVETFLASIFTSVINGDANGSSELDTQTSSFDFAKSESSSESKPVIISNG